MNPEDIKANLNYLRSRFQTYYRAHPPPPPDRFTRREFAFITFGGHGMHRHIGYNKATELTTYLQEIAPQHAYYSTAYYHAPDASHMKEKGWMGAELIFDLDADHLPNADTMSYEQQLNMVKKEFKKLVNDFLLNDFGFNEEHIQLTFSGGRGYHCHVKDPKILTMDSHMRREIVDYITARDLDISLIFKDTVTDTIELHGRTLPAETRLEMPKPDEPGWHGRISRTFIQLLEEILQNEDPITMLQTYGIKKKQAQQLLEELTPQRLQRIKQGQIDQSKAIKRFFRDNALHASAVDLSAGETDEPVTCDIKRLIRLPGSLHGKTGLAVITIPHIDHLNDFNPLRDAVVFPDTPTNIQVLHDTTITLKEETHYLNTGHHTVPEHVAVFAIARKQAIIQ